jgi:adenylate cyclase
MQDSLPRKLAAILYADAVDYSRLMGENEDGAHRLLSEYLDLISTKIERYNGKVVHFAGDAILAEFSTVTDALTCAMSIQNELATRNQHLHEGRKMEFRMGINLGEVIVDRDDIYGDGVNIAARLEGLAQPGGICISESARAAVGKKLSVNYESLGVQEVKNIAEPVRAYLARAEDKPDRSVDATDSSSKTSDQLSVAVFPFTNLGNDPDQEYFADGLTEDLITALSAWRSFQVISRSSVFTYKNRNINTQQIVDELGAHYVLEGSVRKAGNRIRVNAQLTDAKTGHNLWAENFDRNLVDVFDVQDEITRRIAATVVPEFEHTETERAKKKHPENLDAWDFYLRGLSHLHKSTKEGNSRAHELFNKALELDPNYGLALSGISYVLNRDLLLDNVDSYEKTATQCLEAARRAIDLDESLAFSSTDLVRALLWCGQHEAAIEEARRLTKLNSSNALAQGWLGAALVFAAQEEGIQYLENAIELAPRDPRNRFFKTHLAFAYLTLNDLDKALSWAKLAGQSKSDFIEAPVALASVLAHVGNKDQAKSILAQHDIQEFASIGGRPFWRRYLYSTTYDLVLEGLQKLDVEK